MCALFYGDTFFARFLNRGAVLVLIVTAIGGALAAAGFLSGPTWFWGTRPWVGAVASVAILVVDFGLRPWDRQVFFRRLPRP